MNNDSGKIYKITNFNYSLDNIGATLPFSYEPPDSYRVFYEMIQNDVHIKLIQYALQSILSNKFTYISLIGQDNNIRDFISNMFDTITKPNLNNFIMKASDCVFYGISIFHKIYEYDKTLKKIVLKNLVYKNPASIKEFKFSNKPPYGISSIVFYGYGENQTTTEYEIPIEQLIIFTNESDGSILNAQSVLVPVYKYYKLKNYLLRLFATSSSKSATYIPVAYYKGGLKDTKIQEIDDLLAKLNASDNARAVIPMDDVDRIEGIQDTRNLFPFDVYIQMINREISKTLLMNVIALGVDQPHGTQEYTDLMLDLLHGKMWSLAESLLEVINDDIVKNLTFLNFGSQTNAPQFVIKRVGGKLGQNVDARVLFNLAQYHLITPDTNLESWLREVLGLPQSENVEEPVAEVKPKEKEVK